MIDPSRLEASVRRVYGDEQFDRDYGRLEPVDEARVRAMDDGDTAAFGGRELLFRDTPGHARHHFCVWDEQTRGWFTGDTFGLAYPDLATERGPFLFPTTTPVQFDPSALEHSVRLLLDAQPKCMYLTHFGRIREPEDLVEGLIQGIAACVERARSLEHADDRTQALEASLLDWLTGAARAHGVKLPDADLREILLPDVVLNTQGLEFWLDHG
jgi:glyoxylase-like metal-dependent hydrolase (beta-lactamase superfamily II)